ncbi:MAG: peptidylprolyl isomerase [Pararhizobium sp.]
MLATAFLAFAVGAQAPALAEDKAAAPAPDTVIATVGGMQITQSDLKTAENGLDPQFANMPEAQRRVAALSTLIDVKMLAKKAEEAGLDKTDEFKKRMAYLRERALHNIYFEKEVVGKISDADVKARYDKEVAAQPPQEEVKASHILVKTEAEAKDIIDQLNKGADFAKLAKEKSTDSSAAKGGELGYFTEGQMVPEFEKAAFALKPGEYTKTPVKTQFGWHVIKVEDKRKVPPPPLDQVSDQVKQVLMRERYFDVLQKAKADMKVDVKDPDLKKAYDAANAAAQNAVSGNGGAAAAPADGGGDSQGGAGAQ